MKGETAAVSVLQKVSVFGGVRWGEGMGGLCWEPFSHADANLLFGQPVAFPFVKMWGPFEDKVARVKKHKVFL